MIRCDTAHAIGRMFGHEAAYDLGKHMRVVGIPGMVRYLCEDCARGRIAPRYRARFALPCRPGNPGRCAVHKSAWVTGALRCEDASPAPVLA